MNEFSLIFGMFVITFGLRFVMFAMAGKITFPIWMQQALKFVPAAVLTAIVIPSVVMPMGEVDISFHNAYLIAGILSLFICLLTNSLLKTIFWGMLIFLILQFSVN